MLTEIKNDYYHYFEDERGQFQGEYKSWYENGIMCKNCFYINNERSGEYESWYENGRMRAHCFYLNDLKYGEYKEWTNVGTLWNHCFYINGKEVYFDEIPYPLTEEDRMYFKLKYNVPLFPREDVC